MMDAGTRRAGCRRNRAHRSKERMEVGGSPLLSTLWDNALSDVEKSYCLENEFGRTFAA